MGSEILSFWLHFGFRTCSILVPFWVQFGTILVPFWIHFGSIWCPFWLHLGSLEGHKASQNRLKIDEKSMQKSMRNSAGFLHGLGSVFGRLWGYFWDPGPLILSVSCRREANSQKFVFCPQHIVEGLLNSRPREIAIIAGFAFSGPPVPPGCCTYFFVVVPLSLIHI